MVQVKDTNGRVRVAGHKESRQRERNDLKRYEHSISDRCGPGPFGSTADGIIERGKMVRVDRKNVNERATPTRDQLAQTRVALFGP